MVAQQEFMKTRLSPTLTKPIGKVYRPYYLVLALLGIAVCIGLIVCAAGLKDYDSSLKDQLFHVWVAIPILVPVVFALGVFVFKSRKLVVLFLILSIIVMTLCGAASMMTGLRYWLDGWYTAREHLDTTGKCSVANGVCTCKGITKMPLKVKSCDDMKTAANYIVGEIVLSALGFIFSITGAFLGFMTICCGPWQFINEYSEEYDIDRNPTVEFKNSESRPSIAGNPNRGFSDN